MRGVFASYTNKEIDSVCLEFNTCFGKRDVVERPIQHE